MGCTDLVKHEIRVVDNQPFKGGSKGSEIVKSILDGVTVGMTERADAQDPVLAKADEDIHKSVKETVVLARAAQHA